MEIQSLNPVTKAHYSDNIFSGPIHKFSSPILGISPFHVHSYQKMSLKWISCLHIVSNLGRFAQVTNSQPPLRISGPHPAPFSAKEIRDSKKVHRGELGSCCSPSQGAVLAHTRHCKPAFLADTSYVPHSLHIPPHIHGCFGGENFLTDSRKEMSWHLGRFFIRWWWSRGELREL